MPNSNTSNRTYKMEEKVFEPNKLNRNFYHLGVELTLLFWLSGFFLIEMFPCSAILDRPVVRCTLENESQKYSYFPFLSTIPLHMRSPLRLSCLFSQWGSHM